MDIGGRGNTLRMRQLQAFAAAWAEATGMLFTGRATFDFPEDGDVQAGLLYATPTMGTTAAERFIALSIGGATKTLYMTNAYFVPDDNFVGLLSEVAKRGVDVRVLTAGDATACASSAWRVARTTKRYSVPGSVSTNGSRR
jgi:cardiolipin synthase A/B